MCVLREECLSLTHTNRMHKHMWLTFAEWL